MSVQSLHSSPTSASDRDSSNSQLENQRLENQRLEKLVTGLLLTIALSLIANGFPVNQTHPLPAKITVAPVGTQP